MAEKVLKKTTVSEFEVKDAVEIKEKCEPPPLVDKLAELYKAVSDAQGDRALSDILYDDPYWEVRARLQKLQAELKG